MRVCTVAGRQVCIPCRVLPFRGELLAKSDNGSTRVASDALPLLVGDWMTGWDILRRAALLSVSVREHVQRNIRIERDSSTHYGSRNRTSCLFRPRIIQRVSTSSGSGERPIVMGCTSRRRDAAEQCGAAFWVERSRLRWLHALWRKSSWKWATSMAAGVEAPPQSEAKSNWASDIMMRSVS